ncbi:phage tail protein [Nitratifractor salsuginis]|uniref:Prophage minor tail Z family protein n=1 Tax=Nitratifractor salsuginis (strain DSM 16511 / JCM 12458 / E9I37-1) TaxID=749222 RepID=E6X1Q0_NITSE|nr:phage tail protein [Nitratifractor salsuginis]ADV47041.1 hypothetical protein Nitsa_1796 [Nitratifractor salsuginis DSM 16511]
MNISIELEGIEKIKRSFDPKVFRKALRSTMSESGKKFKTSAVKDVREIYNVSAKALKSRIRAKLVTPERYEFAVQGRTINLIHFGASRLKRGGISVLVRKDRGRKKIRNAFITRDSHGSLRVFMRKGEARLPIEAKNSLSIPQMFNEKIVEKNIREIEEFFPKRLMHNIDYHLGKLK